MKATKLTYLLVFALALTFAATGCKRNPTPLTRLPNRARIGPVDPGPGPGAQFKPSEDPTGDKLRLPEGFDNIERDYNFDRTALAIHTVHFDFDSHVVKSSDRPHVEAVAAYLRGEANVALLIEGHCDERGTEEYNRSLGERRALAIREMLVVQLGADGNRITTRTHGEDVPVDPGHDESAWRQNRRGEFVVLRPK